MPAACAVMCDVNQDERELCLSHNLGNVLAALLGRPDAQQRQADGQGVARHRVRREGVAKYVPVRCTGWPSLWMRLLDIRGERHIYRTEARRIAARFYGAIPLCIRIIATDMLVVGSD